MTPPSWQRDPWIWSAAAISSVAVLSAWPGISPGLLGAFQLAPGLLGLLLVVVVIAVDGRRRRALSEPETLFWRRLCWAAMLFTAAAFGNAVSADRVWGLVTDVLHLLAYVPVFLAIDLRPHRLSDRRHPWPIRQLQLAGALIFLVSVVVYGSLLPRSWEGERLLGHHLWPADLFLIFLCIGLARRRMSASWRRIYFGLASVFLASALASGSAALIGDGIEPPLYGTASLSAFAPLLVLLRSCGILALLVIARSAHQSVETDQRERSGGRPLLLFDVPVVVVASILPIVHLLLVANGGGGGVESERHWVVLLSIALLTPLGFYEQLFLRRRSSYLEIEHRRAALETEERSMYLDSLIEHSPLAIVVLDPDHRVRLCNPAFEELFDFTSEEVVGSTLDRLISDGANREEAATFTSKVLAGESIHATTRRLRRGGETIDVELYGVPLMRDGELIGIFAIYQNVSDRLQAEQALRESEERFRRLSDATFEGIVVSKDGWVLDCNEQYAKLVGLEPHEVIGRSIEEFVVPSDRSKVAEFLGEDREEPYEHQILRTDDAVLIVEVRGRSVPFEGQKVRVAAVRDMTEHKRFEEEIRQSQKMEAVGRLAGGIAHDFNNLLTVIKGYGQLLCLQMPEGKLRSLVNEILEASERAALMTQRLLAFGRKQAIQPQKVDLSAVISGMEKILRRLIRADIRFDFLLAEDLGKVEVDPSQIEQVVLNLAINAGDAMPEGGLLTLRTFELEPGDSASRDKGSGVAGDDRTRVCLEVKDSGMGMDRETRQQVFEPFFTTKAKGKGTGLGLATVYAIVKQNGGDIEVESEPGEGTCFRIYLPRVSDVDESEQQHADEAELPRGEETVMVVEDEPGVRALAVEFLEIHGYRVLQAEDGEEGVALFGAHAETIDMVLTDVVMPKLNGPQMVRQLLERDPDVRVLYMSGYTDRELGEDAPGKIWRLVQKPFSVADLIREVRGVLDGDPPESSTTRPEVLADDELSETEQPGARTDPAAGIGGIG